MTLLIAATIFVFAPALLLCIASLIAWKKGDDHE